MHYRKKPAIPLTDLQAQRRRIDRRINEAIERVLEHGQFIMGPEVTQLERQLSSFCGAQHAITCASGTDALLLVLMAWRIGPGDAVFVPAFTFAATAEVVVMLGATPIFVDVLPATYNMDPTSLSSALDTASRLRLRAAAVIPVDLFGQPADYSAINSIAREQGMPVLADAAQSFGAGYGDQLVGTLADATATSFFPAKPLGCYGDGGAVLTNSSDLADRIRSLRMHGKGTSKYDNVRVGLNSRLDTIQAAVLLAKLSIFPDEVAARREISARYTAALKDIVIPPDVHSSVDSAWAHYTVRCKARDEMAASLRHESIATGIYYWPPVHLQPAYRVFPHASQGLSVSEALARHVLSLPMHPYLSSDMQSRVVGVIKRTSREVLRF